MSLQHRRVRFDALPAISPVVHRILPLVASQDLSLRDLGSVITTDPALTAQVLRFSNSSLLGRRSEVRSIVQALSLLGSDRIYALIVTASFKRLSSRLASWPVAKRWWRHSLATALLAADISSEHFGDMTEEYTSGLLHDLGRLILLASSPQEYSDLVDRAAGLHQDGRELERELFGFTHEALGGQAMEKFGFPASLIALTTHHHEPQLATPEFRPTAALMGCCCHTASMCGFEVVQLNENDKESEEADDLDIYLKERMHEIEAGLPSAA